MKDKYLCCRKCKGSNIKGYPINSNEYKYKIRCQDCGYSVVAKTLKDACKYWNILSSGDIYSEKTL